MAEHLPLEDRAFVVSSSLRTSSSQRYQERNHFMPRIKAAQQFNQAGLGSDPTVSKHKSVGLED